MKKQKMKYNSAAELDDILKPFTVNVEKQKTVEIVVTPKEKMAVKVGRILGWIFALFALVGSIVLFFLIMMAVIIGLTWFITWVLTALIGMF